MKKTLILLTMLFSAFFIHAQQSENFEAEVQDKNPWTTKPFYDDPLHYKFAIVSDRTGGLRPGVFKDAVKKLNWLLPEFVVSVGDFIPGITTDEAQMDKEWAEFEGMIETLKVPFFYLPGNHDISNESMREKWIEKFGRAYYHFLYKDVLFLCLDSNPENAETIDEDQVAYFAKVLEKHADVRWTFVLMHHPLWTYGEFAGGFNDIERLVEGRPHSVIAGHNHRYLYMPRKNVNYYILASTGGGSQLRGPKFGEFDHVTLVTMDEQGPVMTNLKLDGILGHDVTTVADYETAQGLIKSTNFGHTLLLSEEGKEEAHLYLQFENPSDYPLNIYLRFFHDHVLSPMPREKAWELAPHSSERVQVIITPKNEIGRLRSKSLALDWTMSYEFENQEDISLSGSRIVEISPSNVPLISTVNPVFDKKMFVEMAIPFEGAEIRYTIDGSRPGLKSSSYTEPIALEASTTVKARVFKETFGSETVEKMYQKIPSGTGLTFEYFTGRWRKLPQFDTLIAVNEGIINTFDPRAIKMHEHHFAVRYRGTLKVEQKGVYTFHTTSDDGSQLFIDGKLVVDNDGDHGPMTKSGQVILKRGQHDLEVRYFENIGGELLKVEWETPEMERQEIPFSLISH